MGDPFRDLADPIDERDDGWWYWDETWSIDRGPFDTEQEAREALERYAEECL